jgi:hypothetical protein
MSRARQVGQARQGGRRPAMQGSAKMRKRHELASAGKGRAEQNCAKKDRAGRTASSTHGWQCTEVGMQDRPDQGTKRQENFILNNMTELGQDWSDPKGHAGQHSSRAGRYRTGSLGQGF